MAASSSGERNDANASQRPLKAALTTLSRNRATIISMAIAVAM
jgi:hypothetical protein